MRRKVKIQRGCPRRYVRHPEFISGSRTCFIFLDNLIYLLICLKSLFKLLREILQLYFAKGSWLIVKIMLI
jgi:hypothetical protein